MSLSINPLVCVEDYRKAAEDKLPRNALDYYRSGALKEETLKENVTAISRWYIKPKFLIDVSKRNMKTTVLGHEVDIPFGVAPTAMQKMAHPEGECANAKACEEMGTIFTLSTIATSSIEEVSMAAPSAIKFFQLYIYNDRKITENLVRRAENCGFSAIVLTVDAPYFGIRRADARNQFKLPQHLRMANFDGFSSDTQTAESEKGSGINEYVKSLFDPSLTWDDVKWLKSFTSLPIVLKGILTKEDAKLGIEAGAKAIWVSNHGARQVDGVPPSIEALCEVREAVGNECEVYVDGGFSQGTDIYKALALGARMIFLGRPMLWGLACDGKQGALNILNIIKDELDSTMALTGCASIKDINKSMIVRKETYSRL